MTDAFYVNTYYVETEYILFFVRHRNGVNLFILEYFPEFSTFDVM